MKQLYKKRIASGRSNLAAAMSLMAIMAVSAGAVQAEQPESQQKARSAQQVIEEWPSTSGKVARQMIEQYGEPAGVTENMLVWEENGPWLRTIVHKKEVDHNFPVPHKDVLEQFIAYEVPEEKFSDLARYDGSVVAYRTNGELSARCDKEGANFLALNLANDIVEGQRSVEEARAFYAQTMQKVMQGEKPDYVQGLQFETRTVAATADPDEKFDRKASEQIAKTQAGEGERDITALSREELVGKTVVSADGEAVGQIGDISDSAEGEKMARIELEGFLGLGLGEREITLPLSELSMTTEGEVQTTMSQDELESRKESAREGTEQ